MMRDRIVDWAEKEEDALDRDLAEGRITHEEHRSQLREIYAQAEEWEGDSR